VAYSAEETLVAEGIISTIIALGGSYTTRNVVLVPNFIQPPARWVDILIQVRSPSVTPYAQGGGSYLKRIVVHIGVFKRTAKSALGDYDVPTKDLVDVCRTITQNLVETSAGGNLHIYLQSSSVEFSPSILEVDGHPVKEVVWIPITLWGMAGQRIEDFKLP